MRFGIKNETQERIKGVFAKYPQIEQVILYGSRAIGSYKNGSDIDLTLKGEKLNLTIVNSICNDLDDLFLPYTFDISIFNHISNPDLIEHIERVGIAFYNSPDQRVLKGTAAQLEEQLAGVLSSNERSEWQNTELTKKKSVWLMFWFFGRTI